MTLNSSSKKPTRPLVRYHGGKWRLAPWIIQHIPAHRVYVEPYGGGGSVLLRKDRSYAEIYNDCGDEIVNLFRVARDDGKLLREKLYLTPFARAEFAESYEPTEDRIEQARRTVVRAFMGFGSNAHNAKTGFRANSNRSGTTPAKDWENYPAALDAIIDRLRGVVIEHRDAVAVMQAHDSADCVHYVDPPYVHETRAGARGKGGRTGPAHPYVNELPDKQHELLGEACMSMRGAVIVSGYRCPLYDDIYRHWTRVDIAAMADGARPRVESIWLSPVCMARDIHPPLTGLAS